MSENQRHRGSVYLTTGGNSPSSKVDFRPMQDPETKADMVVRNPAPNASAPAVPACRVVTTG